MGRGVFSGVWRNAAARVLKRDIQKACFTPTATWDRYHISTYTRRHQNISRHGGGQGRVAEQVGQYLEQGDTVTCAIDGLGELCNAVQAEGL